VRGLVDPGPLKLPIAVFTGFGATRGEHDFHVDVPNNAATCSRATSTATRK
jgi:hypothetical protein